MQPRYSLTTIVLNPQNSRYMHEVFFYPLSVNVSFLSLTFSSTLHMCRNFVCISNTKGSTVLCRWALTFTLSYLVPHTSTHSCCSCLLYSSWHRYLFCIRYSMPSLLCWYGSACVVKPRAFSFITNPSLTDKNEHICLLSWNHSKTFLFLLNHSCSRRPCWSLWGILGAAAIQIIYLHAHWVQPPMCCPLFRRATAFTMSSWTHDPCICMWYITYMPTVNFVVSFIAY